MRTTALSRSLVVSRKSRIASRPPITSAPIDHGRNYGSDNRPNHFDLRYTGHKRPLRPLAGAERKC